MDLWLLFWFAMGTAVATGLGALPFFFVKDMGKQWLGVANAIAAGLMLAASVGLLVEGAAFHLGRVLIGGVIGAAFMWLSHEWLERYEHLRLGRFGALDARKMLLIMGVMTVHSFSEGIGVGVSFGGGETLGVFITLAIAIHNIPEGLAISLVMVPRGVSVWTAMGWSVFSSLPQPLMAIPAYLFVESFVPFLSVGLGFAAGAMIWMACSELIPEAVEDSSPRTVVATVALSVLAMLAVQVLLKV